MAGNDRVVFLPYTTNQLRAIIEQRLHSVPAAITQTDTLASSSSSSTTWKLFDDDAILYAAKKIAAASGDARRALNLCRYEREGARGRGFVECAAD